MIATEGNVAHREAVIARYQGTGHAVSATLRELERLKRERRQLAALSKELEATGIGRESRIAAVLTEHKQKLDARFRVLLHRANRPRA